ncbi:hypothetical protein DPX16_15385 [Anabarilius grahami]|uniref:Uncharacterized protein n=1 Tax=Anabarilius grahami TaxID=495550 RepID=A0A3N0XVW0_ANAGA|nr:hypothetical protein DPX16_15385 [Anabarilius grahami]
MCSVAAPRVKMRRSPGGDVALVHAAGWRSSGRCTLRRHHDEVGNTTMHCGSMTVFSLQFSDFPAHFYTDDHEIHKRKRRRKKKVSLIATARVSTPPAEGAVQGQTYAVHASNEGQAGSSLSTERLSKNRKRKMKKKRHKEKLVALGLVPHVRAVEFTYAQSGHGNLEEVLDLLRTTQEIYLSDHKSSGNAFYYEVSVVCTLIEYWLTEILPIQREQKT